MARRVTGLAPWQPTGKSLEVVKIALGLEDEWPVYVRRVLYLAHAAGLYREKNKASYDAVSNVLNRARRAGVLPFHAIKDSVTRMGGGGGYDSPEEWLRLQRWRAEHYHRAEQEGQASYLVAWCEHRGLADILAPVANEYGVPLIPSGGYDGLAARYHEAEQAVDRDVPTVVLHLSDLDRDGEQITNVLRRDLPDLYRDLGGAAGRPLTVERIALTADQAREVYPDRDRWWGIQLDAMPTPPLQAILRDAITSRIDLAVYPQVVDRSDAERAALLALLDGGTA